MPKKASTTIEPGEFQRPEAGPVLSLPEAPHGFVVSERPGWQSNGGPTRGHPARSYPFSFEVSVPEDQGILVRVHLLGIFGLYADRENEALGTLGASVQLLTDQHLLYRHDLVNGRHYVDARNLAPREQLLGDGTSVESVGETLVDDAPARVDIITLDVPAGIDANLMRFRDLGSPASFVVFDVLFESETTEGCPFGSRRGGISLGDLGAVIRVGDRVRFNKAMSQLESALISTEDLDEARGQALTFLAVVTAATLEQGGTRELHRQQLEAAREFESLQSREEIAAATKRRVDGVSHYLFTEPQSPSSHLVDRALAYVERNFAKEISDATIADQLGLSTSHFRFLFRQATGQPFHKYLIALRLEKARRLLMEGEMPIGDIARAVGFSGLSHFSRAFAQRFQVSPTSVRRNAR